MGGTQDQRTGLLAAGSWEDVQEAMWVSTATVKYKRSRRTRESIQAETDTVQVGPGQGRGGDKLNSFMSNNLSLLSFLIGTGTRHKLRPCQLQGWNFYTFPASAPAESSSSQGLDTEGSTPRQLPAPRFNYRAADATGGLVSPRLHV